jgi:hypothetical protein
MANLVIGFRQALLYIDIQVASGESHFAPAYVLSPVAPLFVDLMHVFFFSISGNSGGTWWIEQRM